MSENEQSKTGGVSPQSGKRPACDHAYDVEAYCGNCGEILSLTADGHTALLARVEAAEADLKRLTKEAIFEHATAGALAAARTDIILLTTKYRNSNQQWKARVDSEVTRAEKAEDERDKLLDEIIAWESATGLITSAGDPDGITPAQAQKHWEGIERERNRYRAALREIDERWHIKKVLRKYEIGPAELGE